MKIRIKAQVERGTANIVFYHARCAPTIKTCQKTTARCAHKELETLYKELSDEMIDSEVGFNLRCDLEELWSYIINAQGAAKMLRLNLERGHDSC